MAFRTLYDSSITFVLEKKALAQNLCYSYTRERLLVYEINQSGLSNELFFTPFS
jgi:hypothetical protein